MERIEKKIVVYKANDGREFERMMDCEVYEKQIKFRDYCSETEKKVIFEVTEKHLKLLKKCYIEYYFKNENDEKISFFQDFRRPYGSQDWYDDISKILEIEPSESNREYKWFSENQYFEMWKIHFELCICVQILCKNLEIKKGFYKREKYTRDWIFSH